jgi:hypothetical protein
MPAVASAILVLGVSVKGVLLCHCHVFSLKFIHRLYYHFQVGRIGHVPYYHHIRSLLRVVNAMIDGFVNAIRDGFLEALASRPASMAGIKLQPMPPHVRKELLLNLKTPRVRNEKP